MKKFIFSLFLSGAILSASPVDVTLLNAGNGAVDSTGQYYVGPYTLTLDGTPTPAMCMNDFLDTNPGYQWSANQTSANSSDLSNTYLGNSGTTINGLKVSSGQIYQAEAYLFSLLIQPGADQADIQEAAWVIMDLYTDHTPNSAYINSISVQNFLYEANTNAPSFDASYYSIISDVNGKNQEFMVADAPEPASFALLGGGLLAVAAAGRFFRRKEVKA